MSAGALAPRSIRPSGQAIVCLDSCESTNDEAWRLALDGAPDRTAVFAEEQRRGRGRFGRTWTAPRGSGLLCSVILRPGLETERVPLVTAVAALAVADTVESAGIDARIVFPNDVYVDGRKIAGVLVESRFVSSRPDLFIVGIGLNVNAQRDDFPPELRETATSLRIETGKAADRNRVARTLLDALDDWTSELAGNLRRLKKAWRDRAYIIDRRVKVKVDGRSIAGTVVEVDPLSGLEIRLDSGHVRPVRGEHVEKLDLL